MGRSAGTVTVTAFHLGSPSHKPRDRLLIIEQKGVDHGNSGRQEKAEKRGTWCGNLMSPSVTVLLVWGTPAFRESVKFCILSSKKKKRKHHTTHTHNLLHTVSRGFHRCPEAQLWTWTKAARRIPGPTLYGQTHCSNEGGQRAGAAPSASFPRRLLLLSLAVLGGIEYSGSGEQTYLGFQLTVN